MDTARRPIGYYLKQLDRLIEERFERDLATHRIARRHWQILNILHSGPTDSPALTEALRPFWTASGIAQQAVLDDLVQRGTVSHDSESYDLTPSGRALHAAVLERVTATRELLLDGLTADDYQTVVDTLQHMARNLDGDENHHQQAGPMPAGVAKALG
jgi:DNA-binding MarR family transcriptional regulator